MKLRRDFANHFSFWFVVIFATPLFISVKNPADIEISLLTLSLILAVLCLTSSLISTGLGRVAGEKTSHRAGLLMLGFALVLAIQCNIVHDLFFYGNFNGEAVNFRSNGDNFHYEWYGFVAGIILITLLLQWLRPGTAWLATLPIVSSGLLLVPALIASTGTLSTNKLTQDFEPEVFEFSSNGNLVHLLPDGFQSDIAQQVLEEHPELAARFEGFTFFSNHLGMFQGTAPSVPTILTGKPFDLDQGHDYEKVIPEIRQNGYPTQLKEAGYRLDYTLISSAYCAEGADSCVVRPFNDMKARGYFRHKTDSIERSFRIMADLSLFRLMPMVIKEKIYDDGYWHFSDTSLDGSSPWPDPVVREWSENMQVTDGPPVFKFYHYIGTHIPPHWDAQCQYHRSLDRKRDNYIAQSYCVLVGIANFLDSLKAAGIYDQTAIVISGDHGCGIAPLDELHGSQQSALSPSMMGSARPAFMVKEKNSHQALTINRAPTSLVDIAPTILEMAGLPKSDGTVSAFDLKPDANRERKFVPYSIRDMFTGNPIPHVTYTVGNDVRDSRGWLIENIQAYQLAPSGYDPANYRNGNNLVHGLRYTTSEPDKEATWINGRQMAFLISKPAGDDGLAQLEFALHLPKWIPEQSFSLSINGEMIAGNVKIEQGKGYWTRLLLDLPGVDLLEENNFISMQFSHSQLPPGIKHFEVAALLRSIRLKMTPVSDTNTSDASHP